jgi:hypothetical protein
MQELLSAHETSAKAARGQVARLGDITAGGRSTRGRRADIAEAASRVRTEVSLLMYTDRLCQKRIGWQLYPTLSDACRAFGLELPAEGAHPRESGEPDSAGKVLRQLVLTARRYPGLAERAAAAVAVARQLVSQRALTGWGFIPRRLGATRTIDVYVCLDVLARHPDSRAFAENVCARMREGCEQDPKIRVALFDSEGAHLAGDEFDPEWGKSGVRHEVSAPATRSVLP